MPLYNSLSPKPSMSIDPPQRDFVFNVRDVCGGGGGGGVTISCTSIAREPCRQAQDGRSSKRLGLLLKKEVRGTLGTGTLLGTPRQRTSNGIEMYLPGSSYSYYILVVPRLAFPLHPLDEGYLYWIERQFVCLAVQVANNVLSCISH